MRTSHISALIIAVIAVPLLNSPDVASTLRHILRRVQRPVGFNWNPFVNPTQSLPPHFPSPQTHPTAEMSTTADSKALPLPIWTILHAYEQGEGHGARVRRSIGTSALRNLSPFLMLDHFSVDPGAGFPDHPHRGQETITYLMQGAMDHEDFAGNRGSLMPGDLQFMTAGKGIMHAEMPRHDHTGKSVVGLQLWVDLPKQLKKCEPRYRDLHAKEIPSITLDSEGNVLNRSMGDSDEVRAEQGERTSHVKIISGHSHGVDSQQELAYTPVWLLDFNIKKGGRVVQSVPKGWTTFAYLLKGRTKFVGSHQHGRGADAPVDQHNIVLFENNSKVVEEPSIVAENAGDTDAHFVLIAGTKLDQEIVQYGPFVLNSQQEVKQAMFDFRGYANGFERAKGWESQIGKKLMG